jgi:hypothetical protein
MNLGVAVVTGGDAVVCPGGLDLLVLDLAVGQALILVTGLEEAPTAATAEVVGAVGVHVHKIFLAHHRLDHEAQILGDGIAEALTHDLARILDGEFDLQVLVPVAVDLQFTLADPLGVVFVDVLDDEVVRDVELFQSCQD